MEVVPLIFIIIFVVAIIFFTSKKGRNKSIESFAGKIIHDYGEFGESFLGKKPLFGVTQKLRLLKCEREGEVFHLIESTQKTNLSFQINYVKLSKNASDALIHFLTSR